MIKRGIGIAHYNRAKTLKKVIESVLDTAPIDSKIIIADDGSDEDITNAVPSNVLLIKGQNKGVAINKNRILHALQGCHFIAIIEDDLFPNEKGWFETYETASMESEIHHFCRVQNKEVKESIPAFSEYMQKHSLTPIYGPSPRGDFTFITSTVLCRVGGFNPLFRGAGYAHEEWNNRIFNAGLIGHPLKWVDIKESRDKLIQIGDREGGRWNLPQEQIKAQLKRNMATLKKLRATNYIYCPIELE